MSLFDVTKHARNYHRGPTEKQKEYALQLGIDPTNHTFSSLSAAIDDAKESRFAALCKEYDRLDSDLQRTGDILTIAEGLTTLKKDGNGWHSGPCPQCGGRDRFYINTKDNKFKCGHAQGGSGCGWSGGLAQLAAYAWNCSTWDAIDTLTGQSPRHASVASKHSVISTRKSTRARRKAEKPASDTKPYLDFSDALRAAVTALRGPDGQAGRNYLTQRSITRETWEANRVGLIADYKRGPTVCFPHELMIDSKMQIISLNRRFTDDEDRYAKIERAKQAGKKIDIPKTKHVSGGRWGLYRLAPVAGARALIIIEGEINGLSVWLVVRTLGLLVDVISVGSEGAFRKLAAHISEAAQSYERLIIWADKAEIADKASRIINHHAPIKALRSPTSPDGEEWDANELLTRGLLADYLTDVLPSGLLAEDLDSVPTLPATTAMSFDSHKRSSMPPTTHQQSERESAHAPTENGTNSDLSLKTNTNGTTEAAVIALDFDPEEESPEAAGISDEESLLIPDDSYETFRSELLYLCTLLCEQIADREKAGRWYLVCEDHYIDGDYTSLQECYQAIQLAISQNRDPNPAAALPPPRPNYDEYPVIADDDPFHRWVWTARAVQAGHLQYLGEAREWAGKIEDRETREQAFRETDQLAESCDVKQMKLL